uniref:Uncharacterized protein n=1 Tax=Helianthus annuus TaxID=4232 RepID=A0A251TYI2_HELAN
MASGRLIYGFKPDEADPELEATRQRRMQELMAQRGGGSQQTPEQQTPDSTEDLSLDSKNSPPFEIR